MTKPTIRIHNSATDEIIDREMTEAEYKVWLDDKDKDALQPEQQVKAELDKAAILAKLGITADEAKLLLS